MVPEIEVLHRSGILSLHTIICRPKAQLRWAAHAEVMPGHRLPKKLLYGELQVGNAITKWTDEKIPGHTEGFILTGKVWLAISPPGAAKLETG
jgi:hypothetical protein